MGVLGTQSIGCFRFEPCSTIEDERKHEEGKLEFRDAEDLLVETKRAWWSAKEEGNRRRKKDREEE